MKFSRNTNTKALVLALLGVVINASFLRHNLIEVKKNTLAEAQQVSLDCLPGGGQGLPPNQGSTEVSSYSSGAAASIAHTV